MLGSMRTGLLMVAAGLPLLACCGCAASRVETPALSREEGQGTRPGGPASPPPGEAPVDFAAQIRPILQDHCTPCHFEGGKMYGRLPFDQPATLLRAGAGILRRIENEEENALLRRFLEEAGAAPSPAPEGASSD